tara:strand:- start:258 stop:473 length:216 start_codon:yes stop_codon:yes gene_type:complete
MVVNPDYDEKICPGGTIANYDGQVRKDNNVSPGYAIGTSALKKPWSCSSLADSDVRKSDHLTDETIEELTK